MNSQYIKLYLNLDSLFRTFTHTNNFTFHQKDNYIYSNNEKIQEIQGISTPRPGIEPGPQT
ncbi:hypothetical protein pb186bvf_017329 [Paramecium bursaria]